MAENFYSLPLEGKPYISRKPIIMQHRILFCFLLFYLTFSFGRDKIT